MDGLTSRLRGLRPPGPIFFVIAGAAAGVFAPPLRIAVTPDLVLLVLLPGLVFEAAYRLRWEDLRRSYGWIGFLAVPGVLISAALIALVLNVAIGMRLELAFVVGAMVSATDPAAVVATFTDLRAPRRLVAVVDAESLLNDGTGLVAFAIAVAAVTRGVGFAEASWLFAMTVVASSVLGAVSGSVAALLVVRVRGRALPVAISLVAAYGTYLAAVGVGLSGVLASVVAGIVLGSYGRHVGLASQTEHAFDRVWEPLAAVLSALIFLAVGLAVVFYLLLGAGTAALDRLRLWPSRALPTGRLPAARAPAGDRVPASWSSRSSCRGRPPGGWCAAPRRRISPRPRSARRR